MSNYTKRIKNVISKSGESYTLTTSRTFVPNSGSKKMFHGGEVYSQAEQIVIYGTPPALRDLKKLYTEAMVNYFTVRKGYKKLKKQTNKMHRRAM